MFNPCPEKLLIDLGVIKSRHWAAVQPKGSGSDNHICALQRAVPLRRDFCQFRVIRKQVSKAGIVWLAAMKPQNSGPTELMAEISTALGSSADDLPRAIIRGIAFCLAEPSEPENVFQRPDRLPVSRARREAQARENGLARDFIRHVLESWVLAQHVYWSVGRGLADARAQGKTLLRLKVVLDEGGWALAPGVSSGSVPLPTADRLQTMVSLGE